MGKILFVEDDRVLQEMYKDKFIHDGLDVEVAQNGEEALEKLRSNHPDLIILDLLMPKMSGFDFLKQIHADPKLSKIPIFVLTNIMADGEDLVKNWGVKQFLLKSSVDPEEIVKKIKYFLQQ